MMDWITQQMERKKKQRKVTKREGVKKEIKEPTTSSSRRGLASQEAIDLTLSD